MKFNVGGRLAKAAATTAAISAITVAAANSASSCPIDYGTRSNLKPNKLYLLFPAEPVGESVDPLVFPLHGFNPNTKWLPLPKFDTDGLKAYEGTTEQLRKAIHTNVANIFCEFNVEVITITTPLTAITDTPATAGPRRNVIGIGLDRAAGRDCDERAYGQSFVAGADPGDSNPRDFARVFAGYFTCDAINLQLEGWANSISGTIAHEAAHNYGLSHADGEMQVGDLDDFRNHLMMDGTTVSAEVRARRRHFSNFETSVLARQVGLAMDTMWIWKFRNPNATSVVKLRIELESPEKDLVLSWPYAGNTSPWIAPVLKAVDPHLVRETTRYQIEWSTGQSWSGGPPGQVPPEARFDIGVTLSSSRRSGPSKITITNVTLLGEDDQALPRQPPWMGFDTGTFDDSTRNRDLYVRFVNSRDQPMVLRDVEVLDLPRVLSIDAMAAGQMFDVFKRKFVAWNREPRRPLAQPTTVPPGGLALPVSVANRRQGRHISVQWGDNNCPIRGKQKHGRHCQPGMTSDDLFPATTVYLTAKVVAADGLTSELFYQIAGRHASVFPPCTHIC